MTALQTDVSSTTQLRALFSRFPTGVIVATTEDNGDHIAVTMNSFSTISLRPPLISICLGRHLRSRRAFERSAYFCISILGAGQEEISTRCAKAGEKDWEKIPYSLSGKGIRHMQSSLAVLECETHSVIRAGDHSILIGEVIEWKEGDMAAPLVFFNSQYQKLS